jgi:hypothetical protein
MITLDLGQNFVKGEDKEKKIDPEAKNPVPDGSVGRKAKIRLSTLTFFVE